jgi:hypothetical protein
LPELYSGPMPIEVRNARFVSVDAMTHGPAPRTWGLLVVALGLVGWPLLGIPFAVSMSALGLALFAALFKRPARQRCRVSVNPQGVWFQGLPATLRIPFGAIACASFEMREVNTGHGNHEIAILVIDLKERSVVAQLVPDVALKPSYEIVCGGYDVSPDDIARCIDGYVKELSDKDFVLRDAMKGP